MKFTWEFRPAGAARLERKLLHPLDFVRQRLTRGLEIGAGAEQVRRGEEVEALVTIASPRRLGAVEVGLVCTEYYACDMRDYDSDGGSGRGTATATAFEIWVPVDSVSGVQHVRLSIPADAPFSYEGSALSYIWEIVA